MMMQIDDNIKKHIKNIDSEMYKWKISFRIDDIK